MLTSQVKTRLPTVVAELQGRCDGALELAELVRKKALPAAPLFAFAVPGAIRAAGTAQSATALHTQELREVVAIVLVLKTSGDATGGKRLPTLEELIPKILGGIAGWEPEDVPEEPWLVAGAFSFDRAQLVSLNTDLGAIIYQFEFSCPLQLRIV